MMNQFMELAFYTVWVAVGIATLLGYYVYYPLLKQSVKYTKEIFKDSEE